MEHKVGLRKLDRTGKCNCCDKRIERNSEEVITFNNKCNNYGLIKICEDCLYEFMELFGF